MKLVFIVAALSLAAPALAGSQNRTPPPAPEKKACRDDARGCRNSPDATRREHYDADRDSGTIREPSYRIGAMPMAPSLPG